MNDVVFADSAQKFKELAGNRFFRCLKVFAAEDGGYVAVPHAVAFDAKEIEDGAVAVCIDQPLIPPLSAPARGVSLAGGMRRAAEQAAVYIAEDGHKQVLAALGELIVSYISDDIIERAHPVVSSLKAEIESCFTDCTYSVDASIGKLPLNYDYVRKLFKRQLGVTPHEYLMRLRMERARQLISSGVANRYSNYTVSQIAEACGFSEPLYFSRVFKKYFSVAPSHYARDGV